MAEHIHLVSKRILGFFLKSDFSLIRSIGASGRNAEVQNLAGARQGGHTRRRCNMQWESEERVVL